MTVVFTSIVQGYPGCQRYAGLNDAIKAARAFSGCPVRIITNDPELKGPEVIRIISVSMPVPCSKNGNLNFSSIARWFLLCAQMAPAKINPRRLPRHGDLLYFPPCTEQPLAAVSGKGRRSSRQVPPTPRWSGSLFGLARRRIRINGVIFEHIA